MRRLLLLLIPLTVAASACAPTPPAPPVDCRLRGPGVDLHGCNLSGLDLSGVNLSGANLRRADLSNSILIEANLTAVKAAYANFNGATMGYPEGEYEGPGPLLNSADLSYADLRTTLWNVDLNNANMTGAQIGSIDFTSASNVKMVNATWRGGIYQGFLHGDFSGIDMTGVWVDRADVVGNFTSATLRSISFEGDGWISGNFTNADLTGSVESAYHWDIETSIWSNTTCPNGVVQSTPCFAAP